MPDLILHGPLGHEPLLEAILGRRPLVEGVTLPEMALAYDAQSGLTQLVSGNGAKALRLLNPLDQDIRRLDFYLTGFGASRLPLANLGAEAYQLAAPELLPWDEGHWLATEAAVITEAAKDMMVLLDEPTAPVAHRRHSMMLSRAASRLRARQAPAPATIRTQRDPRDVQLIASQQVYANFFAVEEYELRHRRFDGTWTEQLNRAVFVTGDAATVLPWDPQRDLVLVVEQFRPGPFARGALNPWLLEAVAGRVDPFETPETCARREAQEEAGVELRELIPVASYYPSPAAKSEMLHSFVALCDLPDRSPRQGGLMGEGEDIRGHILPFQELMSLIFTAEVANAPLILTAQWLAANREELLSRM